MSAHLLEPEAKWRKGKSGGKGEVSRRKVDFRAADVEKCRDKSKSDSRDTGFKVS